MFINHADNTVVRLLLLSISVSRDEFGGIFISKVSSWVLNATWIVVKFSSGPAIDVFCSCALWSTYIAAVLVLTSAKARLRMTCTLKMGNS